MLIVALFLPAIRNNIISVFADELETEGEGDSTEASEKQTETESDVEILIADEIIKTEEIYILDGAEVPVLVTGDVTKEQMDENEAQELDYVEVEKVTSITPHFYVTDADGNVIKDTDGNDLEISNDAEKPIQVEAYDAADDVEYKKEDAEGNLVNAAEGDEGAKAYTVTETADGEKTYEETLKKVTIGDENDENKEEIYVGQDVADVIQDLIDLQDEKTDKNLEVIQNDAEKKGLKVEAAYYVTKVEKGENAEEVVKTEIEITPDAVDPADVVDKSPDGTMTIKAEGNAVEGFYIKIKVMDQDGNETKEKIQVDSDRVSTKTVYTVKDKKGNVVVSEMDVATKVKIEAGNFKKVNNKYMVKDINGNDVTFTADQWEILTEKHVVYEETTKYYYTTANKYYVADPDGIILEDGEKSGKLQVEFWENDVIRRTGSVTTEKLDDGRIKITIPYEYRGYDKEGKEIWISGEYVETRSYDEWFNGNDEATLSIKYTPTITNTTTVEFSTVDEEITVLPDGKIEVIENGGEPINNINSNQPMNDMGYYGGWHSDDDGKDNGIRRLAHVDVKTEGIAGEIDGKDVSARVSNVEIYTSVNGGEPVKADLHKGVVTDDNRKDNEFITAKRGQDNVNDNYDFGVAGTEYADCSVDPLLEVSRGDTVLITIKATITYEIDGVLREFQYTVNVYPERSYLYEDKAYPKQIYDGNGNLLLYDENGNKLLGEDGKQLSRPLEPGEKGPQSTINECRWWYNDGGFDYTIKADAIEKLVKQHITSNSKSEITVTVGEGKPKLEHPTPLPEQTPPPETPGETPEPTPGTPEETPEPTPETPDPTPETTPGTPDPTPETTPGTTPAPEVTPTPRTPEETPEPTPETPEPTPAVTPTVPTTPNEPPATPPTVLGARRVQMGVSEASVLGARRGLETAVLGKRRRPSTGDSIALFIWIIVLSVAMGGAISSVIVLESERDKRNRKMS